MKTNKSQTNKGVYKKLSPMAIALGFSDVSSCIMFPLFVIEIPCRYLMETQGIPNN